MNYGMGKWMTILAGWLAAVAPPADAAREERVVLVHGLGRTSRSMNGLRKRLEREGYRVDNLGYPSRRKTIAGLTDWMRDRVFSEMGRTPEVSFHFVTHSLGGVLLRACFAETRPANLGRVVMLGPPNRGTELTDRLGRFRLYRWVTGPAGLELGTGPESLPNRLGAVPFETGVIAGNRSLNPLYSSLIAGPDDGKVSVARAQVEGLKDFLVVPYSHTFLMNRDVVRKEVVQFLKHGCFSKDGLGP